MNSEMGSPKDLRRVDDDTSAGLEMDLATAQNGHVDARIQLPGATTAGKEERQ